MLKQIRYFQAIVRNNSFSKAAVECHISQSAISQQLQSLEQELGFSLLERHNRKFTLTAAGEHFYQKSLVLISDFDRLCMESIRIARSGKAVLRVGCPRCYGGQEFRHALELFSGKFPDVAVEISHGNHEELYNLLRTDKIDIILSDQRRAFSNEYVNLSLAVLESYIEIAIRNPVSRLSSVSPQELKNIPCILVASPSQREIEQEYYSQIMGFRGPFLFEETLEAARLSVISGNGVLPMEGGKSDQYFGIAKVPLIRGGIPVTRNYCAFWKQDNSGYYIEIFGEILREQFSHLHKESNEGEP